MLVLGLDTSSPAVSVALVELLPGPAQGQGEPRWGRSATRSEVDARRHGELLAGEVEAVLAELGAVPADLGAVACGVGPGPYTGLRVGVVTATTLASALGLPTYGVCSLDAVDDWDDDDRPRLVVTDARRKEVYWAEYAASGERLAGPSVLRPAALAQALAETGWQGRVVGDGALLHAEHFPQAEPAPRYPSAEHVVLAAARRALAGAPSEVLTPLYLRRPDATPPVRP